MALLSLIQLSICHNSNRCQKKAKGKAACTNYTNPGINPTKRTTKSSDNAHSKYLCYRSRTSFATIQLLFISAKAAAKKQSTCTVKANKNLIEFFVL